MPQLWTETIETHRREVREAILDAAAALVAEQGPLSVTMSQIAETAGIGRATLYKYYSDVEAILAAWHDRQVSDHLAQLVKVRGRPGDPMARLEAVLRTYALAIHSSAGQHDPELVAFLHRDEHVAPARRQLHTMIRDLLAEGAAGGQIRDDVVPAELADYCFHALAAARTLGSRAAVRRLVMVTLDGLRPQD